MESGNRFTFNQSGIRKGVTLIPILIGQSAFVYQVINGALRYVRFHSSVEFVLSVDLEKVNWDPIEVPLLFCHIFY